jgi:hypothetical protein
VTPATDRTERYQVRGLKKLGLEKDEIASPGEIVDAVVAFANGAVRPHWLTRAWNEFVPDDKAPATGSRRPSGRTAYYERSPEELANHAARKTASSTQEAEDLMVEGAQLYAKGLDRVEIDASTAQSRAEAVIDGEVAYARSMLAAAYKGRRALMSFIADGMRSHIPARIELVAKHVNGRPKSAWSVSAPGPDSTSWVQLAAWLLAGGLEDSPVGNDTGIGYCHLESCSKFFVINRNAGHRPRTKYCKPKHRTDYHELHAAERKRKSRAASRSAK